MSDEFLEFANEVEDSRPSDAAWKILIVDDEEEVHSVTRMVLEDFSFAGMGVRFLSAYSSAEAVELLKQHDNIALVFLDVVMEAEDAGLRLVKYIRNDLKNHLLRIILRTGQPGKAPESKVIVEYDINDYKEKTELTAQKLQTTVVAALRSYRDLLTIEMNKNGLEKIIQASPEIFRLQSLQNFASGVLTQLVAMLYLNKNSLYVKASSFAAAKKRGGPFVVLAATGGFVSSEEQDIEAVVPQQVLQRLQKAMEKKTSCYSDDYFVLYWQYEEQSAYLVYMECIRPLTDTDKRLLDIFFLNVSTAFENLSLHIEMDDTQREVFFRLVEVAETRSRETGNHVRRVGEYAGLLAARLGLSEKEQEIVRLAASMHDIGKLGTPDVILEKPGKLTKEEFEVVKQHAKIGFDMLHGSDLPMLKAASLIAAQHHERYDGTGYPLGLSGEDIHLYARITSIADVFDALGCARPYKEAWPLKNILEYFREQKGHQFDPVLVDLLFSSMEEVLEIRRKFAD